MPSAPTTLAYDEFPPGSDLRREYRADMGGALVITAPAGDVPASTRAAISRAALLRSGAICAVGLGLIGVLGWFTFRDNIARLASFERVAVGLLFAAFCLAALALVWREIRSARLDRFAAARQQMTLLHATADRLLIETSGPGGSSSHDLRAPWVLDLRIEEAAPPVLYRSAVPLLELVIVLADRPALRLLPGRERSELRWTVAALRKTMGLAIPDDTDRSFG